MEALITGATSMDAAYLADILLKEGHGVTLTTRRVSTGENRFWRLETLGVLKEVRILPASLDNYESLLDVIRETNPDFIFHLAAQSSVRDSFEDEWTTFNTNTGGTHRMLQAYRHAAPGARFFNACSSEVFGKTSEIPQRESTKFSPRSPYGISKATSFEMVRYYRERYGLQCSSGIMFNHTSPLQSPEFVFRKCTMGSTLAVQTGKLLELGDIDVTRDWGHARDYMTAAALMVGAIGAIGTHSARDYVIASREPHTIEELLKHIFKILREEILGNSRISGKPLPLEWGNYVKKNVGENSRPLDVDLSCGDPFKIERDLGWKRTYSFESLAREMVISDWKQLSIERVISDPPT